jgi:hypothetical protein
MQKIKPNPKPPKCSFSTGPFFIRHSRKYVPQFFNSESRRFKTHVINQSAKYPMKACRHYDIDRRLRTNIWDIAENQNSPA